VTGLLNAVRFGKGSRYGAALMLLLPLVNEPAPAAAAEAADYRTGDLVVSDVRSSPTPPVASVGAVYFSIANAGRMADRLLAISSPIAGKAEIHESRLVNGNVEMRPVASVECPAGATVKIAPGGLHVMLLGLTHPLTAGMQFPLLLRFRDAGTLTVQVVVDAWQ
jgi:copper(I)-binding protein